MNKFMQFLSKTKFHLYLIAVLNTVSFQAMSTNYTNEDINDELGAELSFSEVHAELDNSNISMSFSNDYSSLPDFFVRVEVNDNYQMSCEKQRCFYSRASVNNNEKTVHRKTNIPLSFGDKVTFTMRTGGKNGKIVDKKEVIVTPYFSKVEARLENNTISMSFSDTYSSFSDFFVRVEVNGNYQMSCEQQTCYYSWPSVKNNEKEVHRVTSEPLSFGDRVTFTMRTGGSNGKIVDRKEVVVNPYFSEVEAQLENNTISMSFSDTYSSFSGFFVRAEVNGNYQMSCEQQTCYYSWPSINNNEKEVHRVTSEPLSFGDKVTFTMRTGGSNGEIVDKKEVIVNPHFSEVKALLKTNTISMSFSDTYSSFADFFVRVEVNGNYQMSCDQHTCYYSRSSVTNNEKEVHRVTSEPLSIGDKVTFMMRSGDRNGEMIAIKEVVVN